MPWKPIMFTPWCPVKDMSPATSLSSHVLWSALRSLAATHLRPSIRPLRFRMKLRLIVAGSFSGIENVVPPRDPSSCSRHAEADWLTIPISGGSGVGGGSGREGVGCDGEGCAGVGGAGEIVTLPVVLVALPSVSALLSVTS